MDYKRMVARLLVSEYLRVPNWTPAPSAEERGAAEDAIRCIATRIGVYTEFDQLLHESSPDAVQHVEPEDSLAVFAAAITWVSHYWKHDHFAAVDSKDAAEMNRLFTQAFSMVDRGMVYGKPRT